MHSALIARRTNLQIVQRRPKLTRAPAFLQVAEKRRRLGFFSSAHLVLNREDEDEDNLAGHEGKLHVDARLEGAAVARGRVSSAHGYQH